MSLTCREAVMEAASMAEAEGLAYRGWSGDYGRVLLRFGNQDGSTFWASQATMAAALAWSVDKLRKVLRTARKVDLLRVRHAEPVRGPDGRYTRKAVNRYSPMWKRALNWIRTGKAQVAPTVTDSTLIPKRSLFPAFGAKRARRALAVKAERRVDCGACGGWGGAWPLPETGCPKAEHHYCALYPLTT